MNDGNLIITYIFRNFGGLFCNMIVCKKRKICGILAFMLLAYGAVAQQYNVTGGTGVPLMALDNNADRIQIYLVFGMENVQLSYTSSSSSHQWYRYKTSANSDSEVVASTQNGTTSSVNNVEEGYGYYVKETDNIGMNRFVMIIDYSKYEFTISDFRLSSEVDQCIAVRFDGVADVKDIVYFKPNGSQDVIKRQFELHYETLEWDGELKYFSNRPVRQVFDSNPFGTSFPFDMKDRFLKDTEIKLTGDLFARHFGVEKSISFYYEAKALEIHADTVVVSSGMSNMSGSYDDELHAPAVINFRAYSNTPTASRFLWKIYRENDTIPFLYHDKEELEHTFNLAGVFIVKLEVSDRTGMCSNDEDDEDNRTFVISITETEMIVPNAFSPGTTPGINDIFKVKYKSVVKFRGWIYNRWSNELFSWDDPAKGWDGKYRGQYVPAGAYYYLIEYVGTDGKKRTKKGDINVFRSKTINDALVDEGL
jgi:hypothetical protein